MKNKPEWNADHNCPQTDLDEIDEAMRELIKTDMVEVAVGEDGVFYFSLTTKGLEHARSINK